MNKKNLKPNTNAEQHYPYAILCDDKINESKRFCFNYQIAFVGMYQRFTTFDIFS